MENNNSNEPITLGELKKEKTGRPIFVLFLFILLIGVVYGLPYIKDYISNNGNIFNSKEDTLDKSIVCTKEKEIYKYTFYDEKLTKIYHTFSYEESKEDYLDLFTKYTSINKNINKQKLGTSSIKETDTGFEFTTTINLEEFDVNTLDEKDVNYFDIDEEISLIKSQMSSRGYNCV